MTIGNYKKEYKFLLDIHIYFIYWAILHGLKVCLVE